MVRDSELGETDKEGSAGAIHPWDKVRVGHPLVLDGERVLFDTAIKFSIRVESEYIEVQLIQFIMEEQQEPADAWRRVSSGIDWDKDRGVQEGSGEDGVLIFWTTILRYSFSTLLMCYLVINRISNSATIVFIISDRSLFILADKNYYLAFDIYCWFSVFIDLAC